MRYRIAARAGAGWGSVGVKHARRTHLVSVGATYAACGERAISVHHTLHMDFVTCRRCRRSAAFQALRDERQARKASVASIASAEVARCRALIEQAWQAEANKGHRK